MRGHRIPALVVVAALAGALTGAAAMPAPHATAGYPQALDAPGSPAAPAAGPGTGALRAGASVIDLSWNVGRNQGQMGRPGNAALGDFSHIWSRQDIDGYLAAYPDGEHYDPFLHTATQVPTEGIQGRLSARALVVEGPDGTRAAFLKVDHYLQQDLLHRRTAQLVEDAGVGISRERLMIGATHNHSAPYGATPSWGVWIFADVFDAREFDYFATRMATAVIEAARNLRPVRVGASVGILTEVQQNILGPATADDGTPAGFPRDHVDSELAVIRFDDVSDPTNPSPYATLINFGMHPESLTGTGLLSPDFVGDVEAAVDRDTGAVTVFSQGALGDVEPDRTRANPPEARAEFWRRDYAQQERMSRIIAERTLETWADVERAERGPRTVAAKHVPFATVAPVDMIDVSFPGPPTRPSPTLGNCRTETTAGGTIGLPGFPECVRFGLGPDARAAYEAAREAGLPVPENPGGSPGYGTGQETLHAHLQVMRIGEIMLASCPCEPVTDMVRNFKTRAAPRSVEPEMFLGWTPTCVPHPDDPNPADPDTYRCERPRNAWQTPTTLDVPRDRFERMMAQIHNDAAGWDAEDPESIAWSEAEPADPAEIKGNFTHEHITDLDCGGDPCAGYTLPLMVGTANDYIGYIVTYREYMRGDHYRKSLTPFGPHTADYINTRLVRMAAALQGADTLAEELLAQVLPVEHAYLDARARTIGEAAAASRAAYEAALPDDGGSPQVAVQPQDLERFDAAQVRWRGGSTYTDDPRVRVERQVAGGWRTVAAQERGEVVLTVSYRRTADPAAHVEFASGDLEWLWTATWEVFDETDPGTYRFVIDGRHRTGGRGHDYALASEPFTVSESSRLSIEPPAGLAARTSAATFFPRLTEAPDGTYEARFRVYYPDTYAPEGVSFISGSYSQESGQFYCFRCSFRAWRLEATQGQATVTVRHAGGAETEVPAAFDGTHWVASGLTLGASDQVLVQPGGILDDQGNANGDGFELTFG